MENKYASTDLLKVPKPEILIPPPIAAEYREGTGRLLHALSEDPDLFLAIPRMGVITTELALDHGIHTLGLTLPEPISFAANRALLSQFEDYMFKEKDVIVSFVGDHMSEFAAWLSTIDQATALVEKIKKINPNPKSIFIIDDTSHNGDTLNFVAPAILAMAYGEKINKITKKQIIFRNANWLGDIRRATFPDTDLPSGLFLEDAMKGSMRTANGIRPLENNGDLQQLGLSIAKHNPYPALSNKYGSDALLQLATQTKEALRRSLEV